jgi:hypothetical protein
LFHYTTHNVSLFISHIFDVYFVCAKNVNMRLFAGMTSGKNDPITDKLTASDYSF